MKEKEIPSAGLASGLERGAEGNVKTPVTKQKKPRINYRRMRGNEEIQDRGSGTNTKT